MANEAVIIELLGEGASKGGSQRYVMPATSAVTKGALLKLVDGNGASGANFFQGMPVAGIANADKVAADELTEIGCWQEGDFDMLFSGAAQIGDPVMAVGEGNKVQSAGVLFSGAAIIGYAKETVAHEETKRVRLRI